MRIYRNNANFERPATMRIDDFSMTDAVAADAESGLEIVDICQTGALALIVGEQAPRWVRPE